VEEQDKLDATRTVLLLYLWQEKMVALGPDESPEAWQFLKRFLRIRDDAQLLEVFEHARGHFAHPDSWKQVRAYFKKVKKGIRSIDGEARH
jgi:hypothetical protein